MGQVCSPAANPVRMGACLSSPTSPLGLQRAVALTSTAPESPLTHRTPKFWGFPLRAAPCLHVLPFSLSLPLAPLRGRALPWLRGLGVCGANPQRDFSLCSAAMREPFLEEVALPLDSETEKYSMWNRLRDLFQISMHFHSSIP